ncbi:MAG: hypothetical protein GXO23_02030 [Crenarchaeota archaeon]|nr:hypothetical protein [Thermoproteota archaeon]
MFKRNYLRDADKIDKEIERALSKVEKGRLKSRDVKRLRGLSKIERELALKVAKVLASYCKDESEDCELYLRAVLLKYRPEDVVRLIEDILTENKSILVELKKLVSESDLERARSFGGFRVFSRLFKKASRENLR